MAFLTGSFLVARQVLKDPSFKQSVVLLLQHNAEGAFGLIVNRPRKVQGLAFPVYSGGPCPSEGLFMVHGHADWLEGEERSDREITEGIYLGDSSCVDLVEQHVDEQDLRFRMFTGYAGWGPNQLEGELATGAWAVVPANAGTLFETPAKEMWSNLLPPTLPQPSLN